MKNKSTLVLAFCVMFLFGLFVGMWSTGFLSQNPECFEPTSSTSGQIMQPANDIHWDTFEDYRMPDEVRIDTSIIVFDRTTYFISGYASLSSKIMTITYYENDEPVEIGFERYVNGIKFESQTQIKPDYPKQVVAMYHAGDTAKLLIKTSRYRRPI